MAVACETQLTSVISILDKRVDVLRELCSAAFFTASNFVRRFPNTNTKQAQLHFLKYMRNNKTDKQTNFICI